MAAGTRKLKDLLDTTAKDRQPRTLSCNTLADASRGVGWASGPIAGTELVYAAMMEGDRAFPGRITCRRWRHAPAARHERTSLPCSSDRSGKA